MHGLSVKSNTKGVFDWELTASRYDYLEDHQAPERGLANTLPGRGCDGGPGTIADGDGTGWNTLAWKGTWRPAAAHVADFGLQQDSYVLQYLTSNAAGSWLDGPPASVVSDVGGRTQLRSLWGQDSWGFAPAWKTVLGLRGEHWTASQGFTRIAGAPTAAGGHQRCWWTRPRRRAPSRTSRPRPRCPGSGSPTR